MARFVTVLFEKDGIHKSVCISADDASPLSFVETQATKDIVALYPSIIGGALEFHIVKPASAAEVFTSPKLPFIAGARIGTTFAPREGEPEVFVLVTERGVSFGRYGASV
jgi:hypothetical protein